MSEKDADGGLMGHLERAKAAKAAFEQDSRERIEAIDGLKSAVRAEVTSMSTADLITVLVALTFHDPTGAPDEEAIEIVGTEINARMPLKP
jgi:hypothetical protein